MSKQVSLSALFAAVSMALVSLAAAQDLFVPTGGGTPGGSAPLFEMTVTR